jgi:hypothetical protein
MAHLIFFDYFPFTYCSTALLVLSNWSRFVRDLDELFQ